MAISSSKSDDRSFSSFLGFPQRLSGKGVPPHQNEKDDAKDHNAKALHLNSSRLLFSLLLLFFLLGSFCKLGFLRFGDFTSSVKEQNSQELHLSLEHSYAVTFLWISSLFLFLALIAGFVFAKLLICSSSMENTHTSSSEHSIGSPSYEKIHNKQGCGDQEVEIPVRISSRIRNQVPKSKNDSEYESETIADQSLPPYDPKTNYLALRPRFLYYNPNRRIERIRLWECMGLEECFTSESLSDTETSEETQSKNSSSVEEWQSEEVEECEAAMEETAQVEPSVSKPRTSEAKVESKPYSFFRLKPISLLFSLIAVGWITITNFPLICPVINSTIGKELRFTKLYEPAELTEVARTNHDGLTGNFRLWSTNKVSYFSKMIPIQKESNDPSFLRFGNFTNSQVDLVGSMCLVRENKKNLQRPMKELEIATVQMEEQGTLVIEANGKGEDASQVNPEFGEYAKLFQGPEKIEYDQSKIEQIQEEYHVDMEQGSQAKPELEEANLSVKDEVVEPHNSEVQQSEEESKLIFHEAQSILAEKELEDQLSQFSELELKVEVLEGDEKLIPDDEVEELQGEEKLFSNAKVEELNRGEKLIFNAKVESSGAIGEPNCSESEALTENSQSFEELYLSLKENSSAVKVLGSFLLIIVLTVAAAFISGKQQKSPSPSSAAISIDQYLAKKLSFMATASLQNTHPERLSSSIWPTEFDMVGESCLYEKSSFQRTTSDHKRGSKGASSASEYLMDSPSYSKKESKGASEAQSQERRLRKSIQRESLASSSEDSMGSTSYGSYTSYEKISRKHGCGGQEVVIQVRRSCRIRNQVASS